MLFLNKNLIDLNKTLYRDGELFETAYDSIIELITKDLRRGLKIAYVQQGSPSSCLISFGYYGGVNALAGW